jgi:regulator of RNase E activity RraA
LKEWEIMTVDTALLDALAAFSTPDVLNGLKRLGLPPEKMETMDRLAISCTTPALGVRVGFAATRKVATRRTGGPAGASPGGVAGGLLSVPAPRILVVENVGDWRGPVCIWGELGAAINLALDCRGGITNGPVRDVEEMAEAGFQTFAGGVGVGGGYVDTLEIGTPVTVGGIIVHPGDLIHADRHGVVKVPLDLAAGLPDAIRAHGGYEGRILEVCRSPEFTIELLVEAMQRRG